MNGITYFRLNSPYEGDVTKNCALTGNEVDNNFYTLEGRDIKSVELQEGKIIITFVNGETLETSNITENCTKDLTFDFDEVNGVLTITRNGVVKTISGFTTEHNVNNSIAVDGSVIGNGLFNKPVGISPMFKTGQYRPVKKIIDITNNEKLPLCNEVTVGDRYLTIENVNEYGYLYNYQGLKKIACKLNELNSQWTIPTKEDWDDMLDAIEPCDEFRNHTDARSNKFLGKFAGKFLKTPNNWKEDHTCECSQTHCCNNQNDNIIPHNFQECYCGKNIPCMPSYCGEYGNCHYINDCNHNGIGKYGFNVLPAGYANEAKNYLYFTERAYFWTATNHEYRDAYIKAFAYNKNNVLQDIIASDNYLSVRLVKDYNGHNYRNSEEILGDSYPTVLMPSLKQGKRIWTAINIATTDCNFDCNCDCDDDECCGNNYVQPNNGQGMEFSKKYFTNEWNGKYWMRKELLDGESVVVINTNSDDTENNEYIEYRLVNGELIDAASIIYNKVIDEIGGNIGNLNEKIDNEIERSTQKDEELDSKIETLQNDVDNFQITINNFETRIQNIEESIQDLIDFGNY